MNCFCPRFADTNYYIGLRYNNEQSDWTWVDGRLVTYNDWQTTPTATDNTYCARIKMNKGWRELYCDKVMRFVCETGENLSRSLFL